MTTDLAIQDATPRAPTTADPETTAAALTHYLGTGDLSRLTGDQRAAMYLDTCASLGINPRTRPFDWIEFWDPETKTKKLTFYPNKTCSDQLAFQHRIRVRTVKEEKVGTLFKVVVEGTMPDGRTETNVAYLDLTDRDGNLLRGQRLGNAFMKCHTKAKRRLIFGMLGMMAPPDVEELQRVRMVTVDGRGNVLDNPTQEQKALAADPGFARSIGEPTFEDLADESAPLAGTPDQRVRADELERPERPSGPPPSFRPTEQQVKGWRSDYFGAVSGTSYAEDDGRHDLVEEWTNGRTGSLMTFLRSATAPQAVDFIRHAGNLASAERAERAERAIQAAGRPAEVSERPEGVSDRVHAAAMLTGAPGAVEPPLELARLVPGRKYTRPELEELYVGWAARLKDLDATIQIAPVKDLPVSKLPPAIEALISQVDDLEETLAALPPADDDEMDEAF